MCYLCGLWQLIYVMCILLSCFCSKVTAFGSLPNFITITLPPFHSVTGTASWRYGITVRKRHTRAVCCQPVSKPSLFSCRMYGIFYPPGSNGRAPLQLTKRSWRRRWRTSARSRRSRQEQRNYRHCITTILPYTNNTPTLFRTHTQNILFYLLLCFMPL